METDKKDDVQKSQIKEIKKDYRKKALIYMIYIVAAGALGALFSMVINEIKVKSLYRTLYDFAVIQARPLLFVITALVLILTIITFVIVLTTVHWSLRFMKMGDQESEEEVYDRVERIEKRLGKVLGSTNFFMIVHYFLFSIGTFLFTNAASKELTSLFLVLTAFFLSCVLTIPYLQQKILNIERLLNPEKKGSVYDFKFVKKWEECCDERERLSIYKAAYKAYLSVNNTCLLLWTVCIISGILTKSGFASALMVLIVWGVSICVYNYHCRES